MTGSPTNTGTITVVNLDPAAIAITISAASEPANPTTQTTANFSFSVNDTVSTVQCRLDAAPYGPCTSATTQQYSGLSSGPHTFAVQGTDSAGHTSTKTYTWTVQMAPANTGTLPSISGVACGRADVDGFAGWLVGVAGADVWLCVAAVQPERYGLRGDFGGDESDLCRAAW